jgi:hypothetical protein
LICALLGCTPTGEASERDRPAPIDDEGAPLWSEQSDPPCAEVADRWNPPGTPWIWDNTESWQEPACRLGCSNDASHPTTTFDGITVTLRGGELSVAGAGPTAAWRVDIPSAGLVARRARWATWCRPRQQAGIVLVAHDDRVYRVVEIDRDCGAITSTQEGVLSPSGERVEEFDFQMHCAGGLRIHALADGVAWSSYWDDFLAPIEFRELPEALRGSFAMLERPRANGAPSTPTQELRTATRRYFRRGKELYALDAAGEPLWHRVAEADALGCLPIPQLGLVGCSRCPNPAEHLSLRGDYVVLATLDVRSTVDVYDANGDRIVHIVE